MTKKNRQRRVVTPPTPFEQARDELFQQIMRCEVIGAAPEHQVEWFAETMAYFGQRYPELKPADLNDLRQLGERFVQPPKAAVVTEETSTVTEPMESSDVVMINDEQGEEMVETESGAETADVEETETVPA